MEKVSEKVQETIFSQILSRIENKTCADCNNKTPTWCSIDFGVFICLNCAGMHRQLGPTITRVRSAKLDSWQMENIDIVSAIGNRIANNYWEAKLPSYVRKPEINSPPDEVKKFVNDKYIRKAYITPSSSNPVQEYLKARGSNNEMTAGLFYQAQIAKLNGGENLQSTGSKEKPRSTFNSSSQEKPVSQKQFSSHVQSTQWDNLASGHTISSGKHNNTAKQSDFSSENAFESFKSAPMFKRDEDQGKSPIDKRFNSNRDSEGVQPLPKTTAVDLFSLNFGEFESSKKQENNPTFLPAEFNSPLPQGQRTQSSPTLQNQTTNSDNPSNMVSHFGLQQNVQLVHNTSQIPKQQNTQVGTDIYNLYKNLPSCKSNEDTAYSQNFKGGQSNYEFLDSISVPNPSQNGAKNNPMAFNQQFQQAEFQLSQFQYQQHQQVHLASSLSYNIGQPSQNSELQNQAAASPFNMQQRSLSTPSTWDFAATKNSSVIKQDPFSLSSEQNVGGSGFGEYRATSTGGFTGSFNGNPYMGSNMSQFQKSSQSNSIGSNPFGMNSSTWNGGMIAQQHIQNTNTKNLL